MITTIPLNRTVVNFDFFVNIKRESNSCVNIRRGKSSAHSERRALSARHLPFDKLSILTSTLSRSSLSFPALFLRSASLFFYCPKIHVTHLTAMLRTQSPQGRNLNVGNNFLVLPLSFIPHQTKMPTISHQPTRVCRRRGVALGMIFLWQFAITAWSILMLALAIAVRQCCKGPPPSSNRADPYVNHTSKPLPSVDFSMLERMLRRT
jgi:hypothetical protein